MARPESVGQRRKLSRSMSRWPRARELRKAGFKVEMTRDSRQRPSRSKIGSRLRIKFPHAVFISIHFNSSSGGSGVESYRLAPEGVASNASNGEHHVAATDSQPDEGNAQDAQNIALAAAVHAAVLSRTASFDRGIRHARFKVLRHIRVPAILLEAGFLNDPTEGQRIATQQYQQSFGAAIAQGVQSYDLAVNYRANERDVRDGAREFAAALHPITEPLHPSQPRPPASSVHGPINHDRGRSAFSIPASAG